MVQQRADRDLILQRNRIALQQPAEPVQVTAEQRLIQPVQRPQLGGALRGRVDVAVDKVAGRQGEDAEISKEANSSIGIVCNRRRRIKFLIANSIATAPGRAAASGRYGAGLTFGRLPTKPL